MKRWHILLLGAAVALFAFLSLIFYGASVVFYHRGPENPLTVSLAIAFLTSWPGWLVTQIIYFVVIWAGFVLPSRRPSRRRAVLIILATTLTLSLLGLRVGYMAGARFPAVVVLQTVLSMLGYVAGLAYLWVTRANPEVQPRLSVAAAVTEPLGKHAAVAAKIKDGPDWHKDLLASLSNTDAQQSRKLARWPLFIALLALVLGGRVFAWGFEKLVSGPNGLPLWAAYIETIVMLALFAFPLALVRRRFAAARSKRAEDALAKSDKRPIFYLRSFALDAEIGQPSIIDLFVNAQVNNAEQMMTAQLSRCGPVIAIGRPEEKLPALGAARFYVAHDLWQEKVADVATVARLVVWASGTTPGLQWEIVHLVRSLPPEKLILRAHPHLLDLDEAEREAEWSAFVDGLGQFFPKPLPKPLGQTQYFAFEADFTPIPYAPKRGQFQAPLTRLLIDKQIAPYDPDSVAKARQRRQMALKIGGAAAGVVAAIFLVFVAARLWPGQPKPEAWDALASELIGDELTQTTTWLGTSTGSRPAEEVLGGLKGTYAALDGKWIGHNWQKVPPGRHGPLRKTVKNYQAVYEAAHARPDIEDMFYGRGQPLFNRVTTVAEAEKRLADLKPLREAINQSEQDWSAIVAKNASAEAASRLHAVLMARQRLLEAEAAVLRVLIDHPNDWYASTDRDGSQSIVAYSGDSQFFTAASGVMASRRSAHDALLKAEYDALNPAEASASSSQ